MSFSNGFESMGEIIATADFDLDDNATRVVKVNGYPGYVWGTANPLKFVQADSFFPHPVWRTAVGAFSYTATRQLPTYAWHVGQDEPHCTNPGPTRFETKRGKATKWAQIEDLLDSGWAVKGFAQYIRKGHGLKWMHIECIPLASLSDEQYDALHDAALETIKMIKDDDELDNEFYPDGIDAINWDKLAETHAAAVAKADKAHAKHEAQVDAWAETLGAPERPLAEVVNAFTTTESFVISMRQAASRKNMYRETGHDAAFESDPIVQWHQEMENLAHAEHVAAKSRSPEEAAAAFRAAGYSGHETGRENARYQSALTNPYSRNSGSDLAPRPIEEAIRRTAMPCFVTDAAGNMKVLPSTEQAKTAAERTWYALPAAKKDAYNAKARAYVESLAPAGRHEPLRPDELRPHEPLYVGVSSRIVRALRFTIWLMDDLGSEYDQTASYDANQKQRIAAVERTLLDERAASRDRATTWDRFFEPCWAEGLVQAELPPITPKHSVAVGPTPFDVSLNDSRMAVLCAYGWSEDEVQRLTVPALERTARYLQAR